MEKMDYNLTKKMRDPPPQELQEGDEDAKSESRSSAGRYRKRNSNLKQSKNRPPSINIGTLKHGTPSASSQTNSLLGGAAGMNNVAA